MFRLLLHVALLALFALTPSTPRAQSVLHTSELEIDVEIDIYFRVYDSNGQCIYPEGFDDDDEACEEFGKPYYKYIVPTPSDADWTADLGNDCGTGSTDWTFCWEDPQRVTEFLTLEFATDADGNNILARYVFVPATPSELESFYVPGDDAFYPSPSYKVKFDTYVDVVLEGADPKVKVSSEASSSTSYDDVFVSGSYVIPYDFSYFCSQVGCSTPTLQTIYSFVSPVDYLPDANTRTFTLAAEGDANVRTEWAPVWDIANLELRFPQDRKLVVEGDLDAEGVTFTEADAGQDWGGIDVVGTDASLALTNGSAVWNAATGVTVYDGAEATISDSELRHNTVGLDVRSSTGTDVTGSMIRHNTTGVRADVVQDGPGAPVFCFGTCPRSVLEVEDSEIRNNYGIGLAAYFADVEVRDTEIRNNSSYGIYASSATIGGFEFTNNLVVSNGSTGALAGTGADLFLSPADDPGLNRIASNATSEVSVAQGGFAFLGDNTGLTGDNAVFDPAFDPSSGFRLVKNNSKTPVDANYVYWGDPNGPPQGAFTGSVDGTLELSCDPVLPAAPDDPDPCASSRSGSLVEVTESSTSRLQGLGARIRALRTLLAANSEAPGADSLVYRLGGLHRLDRDDTLGEWAATRALLAALRGALVVPDLPAGARAVGEASLEVEAVRLLQRGRVTRATNLLQTWGEHVSSDEVRQTLALVAAALHSRTGDYAEAVALAEAAAAAEEDEEMRQSMEVLAAHYALRAAEAGRRETEPVQSGRSGEASARSVSQAAAPADVDLAVYPNPVRASGAQSTVAVALAERADVRLAVYDVLGRRVAVLHEGPLAAGAHRFGLNAQTLPAGVYVVRAEVSGGKGTTRAWTERVTVVR